MMRPRAEQVVQDLRRDLARIPGVNTFIQIPPSIRIGGQSSKSLYQFTLQGSDLDALYQWGPKVESELGTVWPARRHIGPSHRQPAGDR